MNKITLTVSGIVCVSSLSAQNRPNIILILADDMRNGTIECLGEENSHTPVLNRLAKESALYTNAHIMGGTSGAVSMPSRAMLMTGKYLYNLEKEGGVIPESHTTLGEALQQAGYDTFHTGKWHSDRKSFNRCFSDGDDIFLGGMADHWNVPLFHYDKSGKYTSSRKKIDNFLFSNETETMEGEYCYSGRHSVDIFTETAVDYIKSREGGEKPYFLSLCYMSPHDPRSMPQEFLDMYPAVDIELPANFMEEHPFDNGELKIRDEVLAAIPRDGNEIKRHIADYYAMITHLDDRIGNVLQALKESGQYDNTVVIFAADNGLAVGQHGLMGKQNLYEHSVNIPLIIKPAGKTAPAGTNNNLCYLLDLYPAICEIAGADIPESCDGTSLLTESKDRKYLYYGYRHLQRAVSDGQWKLIVYRVNGIETRQLFDLMNDPLETGNLINDRRHRRTADRLWSEMLRQKEVTNDQTGFWDGI